MRDKGLIQSVRPESADVRGQQTTLFPFDAFVFSSGRDGGTRYLDLKNGWSLVIRGDVRVGSDLKSEGFEAGVKGWILRGDGTAEFNDVVIRLTLQSDNYVEGVSGWLIDQSGAAEFYDVHIRGKINDKVMVEPSSMIITGEREEGEFRTQVSDIGVEIDRFEDDEWRNKGYFRYNPPSTIGEDSPFNYDVWYRFDGNGDDSSGRGENAVLYGAPSFIEGPIGLPAVSLNGLNQYIEVPAKSGRLYTGDDEDWTVGFWLRPTLPHNDVTYPILYKPKDSNNWLFSVYITRYIDPQTPSTIIVRGQYPTRNFVLPYINNSWMHISVGWESGTRTLSLYRNGTFLGSYVGINVETDLPSEPIYIGYSEPSGGNPSYLKGDISDFRIIRDAGTPVIRELYYGQDSTKGRTELFVSSINLGTVKGPATFTKATNKIEMEGLDRLNLEIGDVIRVEGADSLANNKLFTVEDIDSNRQPFQQIDASHGIRSRAICEWNGDIYFGSWASADKPGFYVLRGGVLPFVTLDATADSVWCMCVHKGQLYSSQNGKIKSVDSSGNRETVVSLDVQGMWSYGDLIYTSYEENIRTVDLATGSVTPLDTLAGMTIRDILIHDDYIYITDWTATTGGVWRRKMSGGAWSRLATGRYNNLAVVDGIVYATGTGIGIQYFDGSNFVDAGLGYTGSNFYGLHTVGNLVFVAQDSDSGYTRVSYPTSYTVNYEHRNGAGPLSLEDEMLSKVSVRLLSKWHNAPLGLGQAWVDVKAARLAHPTTYTNSTGRAIQPFIVQHNTTSNKEYMFYIDGKPMSFGLSGYTKTQTPMIIPRNSTYSYDPVGQTIQTWQELR